MGGSAAKTVDAWGLALVKSLESAKGPIAAFAFLIGTAACGGGGGDPTVTAAADSNVLQQFSIAGLAADPTGGAWLLEGSEHGLVLNRFDESAGLVEVGPLPEWDAVDTFALADGGLAVVGVRCEPVAECDATVSEAVFVSEGGEIGSPVIFTTREGGGPNESDAARIVGQEGGLVWINNFDGQLVALDGDGSIREQLLAAGDPCVIDDRLFTLSNGSEEADNEDPVSISPTADPNNPSVFETLGREQEAFVSAENGLVEAPSNAIGQCIAGGFETFVSGSTESRRWAPGRGWFEVSRALDPEDPRSTHAVGSGRDEFIVDSEGSLLMRGESDWESTSVSFANERVKAGPPLVLLADRSDSVVIGCMSTPSDEPETYSLECHEGVTQRAKPQVP